MKYLWAVQIYILSSQNKVNNIVNRIHVVNTHAGKQGGDTEDQIKRTLTSFIWVLLI